MSLRRDGIIKPPIDELLTAVDSKYQLVIFASKPDSSFSKVRTMDTSSSCSSLSVKSISAVRLLIPREIERCEHGEHRACPTPGTLQEPA